MEQSKTLFKLLGGEETLKKVHKTFYDKIYGHPWLGKYFTDFVQELIEIQQTQFMMEAMGGPRNFDGRNIKSAHDYMFITEELFNIRHALLKKSLEEENIPPNLSERWLKIDYAFKSIVVKKKVEDCYSRFYTGFVLAYDEEGKNKSLFTKKKPA